MYLIKYIICTLMANLSYSDFMDPVKFLQDRLEMFNNKILGDRNELYIGHLDSIKARLRIIEEPSPIKSESPYRLRGTLEYDDGYILELPEIYAGQTNDKYVVYYSGFDSIFRTYVVVAGEEIKIERSSFCKYSSSDEGWSTCDGKMESEGNKWADENC